MNLQILSIIAQLCNTSADSTSVQLRNRSAECQIAVIKCFNANPKSIYELDKAKVLSDCILAGKTKVD